jgi:hypothetical protein
VAAVACDWYVNKEESRQKSSLDKDTTMLSDDVKKSPREEAPTEIRISKQTDPEEGR